MESMSSRISGLSLLTRSEAKSLVQPQCDVYLDDKPENVLDLSENTKARLVCLMDRPWNQHMETVGTRVIRVYGWDDFVSRVRTER